MKTIRSWMSHHPFKVVLFTFLFTIIPSIMAVANDSWFYPSLAAFAVFVVVWTLCVRHHAKNIATHLLVFALLAGTIQPVRPAAFGVAVVVICVGGYCTYKLIKTCQKAFPPKSTNSNSGFYAQGGDEYGGAYEYSSIGSCYEPPPQLRVGASPGQPQGPTTFVLNVIVEPAGATTSMSVSSDDQAPPQTWSEFQSEMASHGLFITGHASYVPQFSRNGVPCAVAMVPLEFEPFTGRVIHRTGGDARRVVIERSPNLVDWSPLLVTDTGVGSGFKVVDTTREGQMFYRVQVTQP